MSFDLVIRGDLVLPEEVLRDGYVAVTAGRIAAIGAGDLPPARETVDARGRLVFPGVIDGQVHAGSAEGFGGLEDLTRSAAAGGVTTVVDMPYDEPDPVVDCDLLARKIEVLEAKAHVDVALYGTVAKQVDVAMIRRLADAGVAAFKISTYESHPKRFPRITHPEMERAFRAIAETGLTVAVHNEDQELVDDSIARAKAAGRLRADAHSAARPPLAELVANAVLLEIGAATGARVHIVHSSLARGFDMARSYRQQGFQATAETCIHYLILTEADVIRAGARGKVNPPIRSNERDAIWQRLIEGQVAFVSSDHCSWPLARKNDENIFATPAGAPGVAVLLPLLYTAAVAQRGLTPKRWRGCWPRRPRAISASIRKRAPFGSAPMRISPSPSADPGRSTKRASIASGRPGAPITGCPFRCASPPPISGAARSSMASRSSPGRGMAAFCVPAARRRAPRPKPARGPAHDPAHPGRQSQQQ
jgi:allantoinase